MTTSAMQTDPGYTLGPIPIPRKRQIAQNLHRIRSVKAGMRIVTCESKLELDAVFAKEGDPDTVWLCEQAFRIDRPIGKKPWCTLDLATRDHDGVEQLYEIKPTEHLVPAADTRDKPADWDEIEAACAEFGRSVEFITELDLEPQEVLIANWRMLLPFAVLAYEDPDDALATQILNRASGSAGISIQDLWLEEPNRSRNDVTAHVAMLLHNGSLKGPLASERLLSTTKLRGTRYETE